MLAFWMGLFILALIIFSASMGTWSGELKIEKLRLERRVKELCKPVVQIGLTDLRHVGRCRYKYEYFDLWWRPYDSTPGGWIIAHPVADADKAKTQQEAVMTLLAQRVHGRDAEGPLFIGLDKARELGCFLA